MKISISLVGSSQHGPERVSVWYHAKAVPPDMAIWLDLVASLGIKYRRRVLTFCCWSSSRLGIDAHGEASHGVVVVSGDCGLKIILSYEIVSSRCFTSSVRP